MKKLLLILIVFSSCKIIDKPPHDAIVNTVAIHENDSMQQLKHDFESAHKKMNSKIQSLDLLAERFQSKYGNNYFERTLKRTNGDTAHVFFWLDDEKNIRFISERKLDSSGHGNLWMAFFRSDTIFKLKMCYLGLGTFDRAAAYYLKDTTITIGRSDFQRQLLEKKHLFQDSLFKEISLIK